MCSTEFHFLFVKDVLDLWYIGYFLFLVVERFENVKEVVKQQLVDSLMSNETIETEGLNERAEKVDKPKNAANIINEYEEILRMKSKGIITVSYHQGKVFIWFCEKKKFMTLVSRFKIHKNTIVFKTDVFKLINIHPALMKSSVALSFLQNMSKKCRRALIGKSHLFKKAFSKLSLQFIMSQKYSDKL